MRGSSLRMLSALASKHNLDMRRWDFVSAFLQGDLESGEAVYCQPPPGPYSVTGADWRPRVWKVLKPVLSCAMVLYGTVLYLPFMFSLHEYMSPLLWLVILLFTRDQALRGTAPSLAAPSLPPLRSSCVWHGTGGSKMATNSIPVASRMGTSAM